MPNTLQNTKDTLYEFLRARLVALNPARTLVLRGITRPAVLVEENELAATSVDTPALPDCFRLRWVETTFNPEMTFGVAALTCEIAYETAGTQLNAGMDRGRSLSAMDAELCAALNPLPRNAPRQDYTSLARGGSPVPDGTSIWWSDAVLGKAGEQNGRLARKATVIVIGLENAGAA